MRIFHFILDHRVGGPHAYVRGLARELAPSVASTLVTTGRGDATELALTNLRHHFKLLYPLEVLLNVVHLCWLLRRRASRRNVLFNVHGAANLAPILAARLLNIPLVWHFHETLPGFATLVRFGKSVVAGIAHRYVVVAARAIEVFDLPEAILIPGGVDLDFWRVAEPVETEMPLRLLAVGNLNPLKGIDILLDALDSLNGPWELVIVGAELQTFAGYAADLHRRSERIVREGRRVEFVGWQSAAQVRELMANTDIFVLPSRSEACPIALLEAMASGLACVASDVGDVAAMLAAPGSGIVCRSGSTSALTAALIQVSAIGREARREMGARARVQVEARYSQRQMAVRHLDIYRTLVQEAKEPN